MGDSFPTFGFDDVLPEPSVPQPSYHLTVELVPQSSWGANLRSALSKQDWDKLRKRTYRMAGYRCEICGGKGPKHPVECHEVWEYNDERHIQTLVRLIALCPSCHSVKHFGRTEAMGRGEQAFRHLMWVNGWRQDKTQEHLLRAFDQWKSRSLLSWTLDLTWLLDNGVDLPEPPEQSDANFL